MQNKQQTKQAHKQSSAPLKGRVQTSATLQEEGLINLAQRVHHAPHPLLPTDLALLQPAIGNHAIGKLVQPRRMAPFHQFYQSSPALMRDPLNQLLPPQINPTQASLSFDLPAGKALTGTWNDLSTTNPTTITIAITPKGLQLSFNPPLLIDAQWPVSNMEWSGVTYDFATASITSISLVDTGPLPGWGQKTARSDIAGFFLSLINVTRVAKAGYDPLADTNPMETLSTIKNNFTKTSSKGGSVKAADVTNITMSASITLKSPIEEGTDEGKLAISGGLSVSGRLAGTAADLGANQPPKVEELTISGDSIIVKKDGKPVAQLHTFSMQSGGSVSIGRMTLLGPAQAAAEGESAGRLLALILALGSGRPEDRLAVGDKDPNLEPKITEELVRSKIQPALSKAAVKLIRENANVIPGIDLTSIFGVGQILPPQIPKKSDGVPV